MYRDYKNPATTDQRLISVKISELKIKLSAYCFHFGKKKFRRGNVNMVQLWRNHLSLFNVFLLVIRQQKNEVYKAKTRIK
jgi:hypothetical protein